LCYGCNIELLTQIQEQIFTARKLAAEANDSATTSRLLADKTERRAHELDQEIIGRYRMSNDADKFRKKAEEARRHAAKAYSAIDREAWLRVAEDWLKLASSADGRN
jgi:hypothetical protein